MSDYTDTPNAITYFWFNPDHNRYEAGNLERFETAKSKSSNPQGFSLILKLDNTMEEAVIQRLITELNIAKEDLFQVAC